MTHAEFIRKYEGGIVGWRGRRYLSEFLSDLWRLMSEAKAEAVREYREGVRTVFVQRQADGDFKEEP